MDSYFQQTQTTKMCALSFYSTMETCQLLAKHCSNLYSLWTISAIVRWLNISEHRERFTCNVNIFRKTLHCSVVFVTRILIKLNCWVGEYDIYVLLLLIASRVGILFFGHATVWQDSGMSCWEWESKRWNPFNPSNTRVWDTWRIAISLNFWDQET